jgi:hypothetical protein
MIRILKIIVQFNNVIQCDSCNVAHPFIEIRFSNGAIIKNYMSDASFYKFFNQKNSQL